MPKLVVETIGTGDQSWLGESGPHKARSQALLKSLFTAGTHYPNGYIPSGLPVALVTSGGNAGQWGPYDSTATDGRQLTPVFVLTDVTVGANDTYIDVAVKDRGRIYTNKLPVAWVAPASAGNFIFLTQS